MHKNRFLCYKIRLMRLSRKGCGRGLLDFTKLNTTNTISGNKMARTPFWGAILMLIYPELRRDVTTSLFLHDVSRVNLIMQTLINAFRGIFPKNDARN